MERDFLSCVVVLNDINLPLLGAMSPYTIAAKFGKSTFLSTYLFDVVPHEVHQTITQISSSSYTTSPITYDSKKPPDMMGWVEL